MFKLLAFAAIVATVYFLAVGFLHTANRMGWSEGVERNPTHAHR